MKFRKSSLLSSVVSLDQISKASNIINKKQNLYSCHARFGEQIEVYGKTEQGKALFFYHAEITICVYMNKS